MKRFEEAIQYAVEKHAGMMRKRESIPFILHPLEVATIVGTMSTDEDLLAAAVLHDTIEDTDATAEEIESRFGARVAMLVASETENKRPEIPAGESWRMRKEESLKELEETTDMDVKILWLADKLANMRSFYRSWKVSGDAIWKSFNQKDPAQQAWYYRTLEKLLDELKNHDAWQEFHALGESVFGKEEE